MTRAQAAAAVWGAFSRRSPERWELTLERHHTSRPGFPVWRWFLDGWSARQDRNARQGFVDKNGVEVEP